MNLILDNLIAEGKAKEMIIVLPYGNPAKYYPAGTNTFAMGDLFSKDLLNDLMPYVEANYRTLNDRDSRAIGGFSRGGNQGLAFGLTNLDKFSYLCSYSSFTSMTLPDVYDNAKKTNKKINLFWLGVGTDDFLYGNAKEYAEFLDSRGIRNVQEYTTGMFGHTWMNARYFLVKTFPLLFNKEASAEAMSKSTAVKPKGKQAPVQAPARPAAPARDGQRLTPELMAKLFPPGVVSPEYNADGSATFRVLAPNAEKVEFECQMFEGVKPMVKGDRGVWSVTVKPDQPDIYPYSFIIDGTKIADPNNVEIFPNEGYKASLADVKGPEPDFQDLQKVPHGKVSYTWYTSNAVGFDRPVCIYTPPGYDPADSKKYPVLYLIHGMTDTYETWFKVGKVNNILDNLIAKGLAEPMIVVMPYANPYPEMILRGQAKMYNPMDTQLTTKEFTESVVPFIEANYNVLTDADNRAIAGFSLGGRQTLACGLGNPDMFHYVCAFAPAIFGPEISSNFENGTYAPAAEINEKMNLVWLSCGTSDFLYQSSLQLEKNFKDRGIEHKTMYPGGGHTWMNCRDYITAVAQLLFK
jgi:enterochelin esterase-like enzyme